MENSENRLLDVFFYGLYMDPDLLSEKKVLARNPRLAMLVDFRLKLGKMATLLRAPGKLSIGMLYSITHAELRRLYWGAGLDAYGAEAVLAAVAIDTIKQFDSLHDLKQVYRKIDAVVVERVPALCCNLIVPPLDDESNDAYQEKLLSLMRRLKIPLPDELLLNIH